MNSKTHDTALPATVDRLLIEPAVEALLLHGASGTIHFATPSAALLLTSDSVIGQNLLQLIEPTDAEGVKEDLRGCTIRGKMPGPRLVRSGTRHLVLSTVPVSDAKGQVVELQTMVRDVTAWVELRDRIQLRELITLASNELAHVGGWLYDAQTNVLHWSREVRRIHEVPEDYEPTVDEAINFYDESHRHIITDCVDRALREGASADVELPLTTFTGRKVWVRVSLVAQTPGKQSSKIFGAFQDITDLHSREQRLSETIEAISRQRDQLEEFAFVISHHLRGPVSGIVTLADSMSEDMTKEESSEALTHIRVAARRLMDTFEDLTHAIAVKNQETPNIESVVLSDLVDRICTELAEEISASGANVSIDDTITPTISYPRVYLETILRQLVSNAIRFAAPGRPPRIRIRTYIDADSHPILEVSDNGLGIDLDRFGSKLFRLRSTFHRGSSTRGLGLFLVKSIVESMGGEINVTSVVDNGTAFRIDLSVDSFVLLT